MKFAFALIALVAALAGVQSAGAPPNANSVYIDFQMKLCQITIIVCTGLLKNKDNFYANAQGENKTISSDQTNKTIAGLIKTHYSQLDKVTNQTIRDELLKLNATVTGCVGLLDVFITQAYLGVATYLAAELAAIVLLVTQFQTSIATILTGISGSVTDTSLNTSKVAECEKVAFAAFDAIIKNASTFSDKCFKNFSDYETKSFTVQIKLVFAAIVLCAQNPLANISSCMKINKISDAKGMDSTTNCTRDSFLTCITFGQSESMTFVSTNAPALFLAIAANATLRNSDFGACYTEVWATANLNAVAVQTAFSTCVNIPA